MSNQTPTDLALTPSSNPNGTHPPPSTQPHVPVLAPSVPSPPTAAVVPPPPVVPHDTRPHLTQAVNYDRLLLKLKTEFPETHPSVIAAKAAIEEAAGWNARRGKTVVFEWPAAHDKAVAAIEVVMQTFGTPGATARDAAITTIAQAQAQVSQVLLPNGPGVAAMVYETAQKHVAQQQTTTRGKYTVKILNGKAQVLRNGASVSEDAELQGCVLEPVDAFAQAAAKAAGKPAPAERPSLLYFGHPNYWEALKFVFRGRQPEQSAGLPVQHILGGVNASGQEIVGYARRGKMIDIRVRFEDAPLMIDEAEYIEQTLLRLVETGFLEVNKVAGATFLRMSKTEVEKMGTYYPLEDPVQSAPGGIKIDSPPSVVEVDPVGTSPLAHEEPAAS